MKIQKRKLVIIEVAMILTCLILFAVITQLNKDVKVKPELRIKEEYRLEGESFNNAYSESLEGGDYDKAMEILDTNIEAMATVSASEHLEQYIQRAQNGIFDESGFETMVTFLENNEVKPNKVASFIEKSKNAEMISLYAELKSRLYELYVDKSESYVNEKGMSYVRLDSQLYSMKYEDYVGEDLAALMNLYGTMSEITYDDSKGMADFEKVLSNISLYQAFIDGYPDSSYIDEVKDGLLWQYSMYLGANTAGNVFIAGTGKVQDEALSSYKLAAKNYANQPIGIIAKDILSLLETNGNIKSKELTAYVDELLTIAE